MKKMNVREYKMALRQKAKEYRRAMSPQEKEDKDKKIAARFLSMKEYKSVKTILCYVSTPMEVDTTQIINTALKEGKRVAVPRCVEGSRRMELYLIESMDQLSHGSFGVREPRPEACRLLENFDESLCIVPALLYDREGYRLGYGAGYYDRFLAGYKGEKVGIIYDSGIRERLKRGRFDIPVDILISEKHVRRTAKKPL